MRAIQLPCRSWTTARLSRRSQQETRRASPRRTTGTRLPCTANCCWMLRRPTDAAEAPQDTFVIAAATPGDMMEAPKLRPWLYSVARQECQRRLGAKSAADDGQADAADRRADAASKTRQQASQSTRPCQSAWLIKQVAAGLSLISSLIHVRVPASITVYYPALSRSYRRAWSALDGHPSS
jgi:DNA-directed RNA polymerase specialized sigma24 family protein